MPPLLAAEALGAEAGAAEGAGMSKGAPQSNIIKGPWAGSTPVEEAGASKEPSGSPAKMNAESAYQKSKGAEGQQVLRRLKRYGNVGSSRQARSATTYQETMPTSRFILMMLVALGFYLMQATVGILFLNPEITGGAVAGVATGVITAETCKSVITFLPDIICDATGAFLGAHVGLSTGVGIAIADFFTATGVSDASNAVGEMGASIIGFASLVCFSLWYWSAGITFFGGKRAMNRLGGYACEAILGEFPFIELLPAIPLSVFFVCYQARLEDKEHLAEIKAKAKMQGEQESAEGRRAAAIRMVEVQREEAVSAQFAQAA